MAVSKRRIIEIVEYAQKHGDIETLRRYDITIGTLAAYKTRYRRMERKGNPVRTVVVEEEKFEDHIDTTSENIKNGTIDIDIIVEKKFKSNDEVMKFCGLDNTIWEPLRVDFGNWTTPLKLKKKNEDAEGKVFYTDELKVVHGYKYSVRFGKIKKINPAIAIDTYKKISKKFKPYNVQVVSHSHGKGYLVEPSIADPHIGRLSWAPETLRGNYDLKIACKRYVDTHIKFRERVRDLGVDQVLLVIGNDYFNVNNALNMTQHGTPQDEDGRWQKSYMKGFETAVQSIEVWRDIAPIKIITCFGNHDIERMFYLGENLRAWYRNDPNVDIDNEPSMVKYFRWGSTILGFTHKIKPADTANLFLADTCDMLHGVKYKEMHAAHIHQERTVSEVGDVTTRFLPSMAELGAWESSEHFRGHPTSLCGIYHKDDGLDSILYRRY